MKILKLGAVVLVAGIAAAGCGDKNKKAKTATAKPEAADVTSDPGTASNEDVRTGLPDPKQSVSLATVHFDLDAFTLTPEAKAILDANATAMRDNPTVTVRVEGHADERGSTQYNVGLGDRRANAVKTYLGALGIQASRLEIVSYGEEKPADHGHDDAAWAKNRRVELAVTAGSDKVSSSYTTTHQ